MLTDADRKLLVGAVNGCFHENGGWSAIDIDKSGAGDLSIASYRCVKCGRSYQQRDNPTFSAPSELGPLILWAKEQEWWDIFINHTYDLWWECEHDLTWDKYMSWLFQSTEHFAKLIADFLREKGGGDG